MGQSAGELSCRELVELVTDYLDDALPAEERARFEEHLEGCQGCRTYVEQMRLTVRLVQATDELEQRPEVAGLMRAFSDWKRDRA
jgi:anti-sigma factor RsiW